MDNQGDETLILETVERVCGREIPRYQNETYYNSVPRELFTSLSEVGLAGLSIAEQYGGMEASAETTAGVFEAISRFDVGPAIFISVHTMVAGLINRFGTELQKKELLPPLASGRHLAAFALTEPQAGSDAHAITTEATKTNGGYLLKGNKCYITSAGFADVYLVFARTRAEPHTGISAFIVSKDAPGLSIGKPEKKMGAELSPIASLFFDNTFVPDSAIIGTPNEGFAIALSGLAGGRVNIAACANGISLAAIGAATKHLRERKQFGKSLAEFQGLQFIVADMHQHVEAARLLTLKAARDLDEARLVKNSFINTKLSSSTAKCFATDAAMTITTNAVQLLGGAGYVKEYCVERYMRDAKMLQIVEGTNQIQRIIIARELLS